MISAVVSTLVVLSTFASNHLHRALRQTRMATLTPALSVCGSQVASGHLAVASGAVLDIDTSCSYGDEVWTAKGWSRARKVISCFVLDDTDCRIVAPGTSAIHWLRRHQARLDAYFF